MSEHTIAKSEERGFLVYMDGDRIAHRRDDRQQALTLIYKDSDGLWNAREDGSNKLMSIRFIDDYRVIERKGGAK